MAGTLRRTAHATVATLTSASTELSRLALDLPHNYSNYVTSNPASISNIESSLRSLTYLLPGARLRDSELASETIHSFIQLLSIYHDHLLKKRANILSSSPTLSRAHNEKVPTLKQSLHAKYTMYWMNSSNLYSKVATLLKVVEYTELLWEMIAQKRNGEKGRWRVVVLLETFKAFCRLILMRLTSLRSLVTPPMPRREDFAPMEKETDPNVEFSEEQLKMVDEMNTFDVKDAFGDVGIPTPPLSEPEKGRTVNVVEPYNMPRTGMTLPTLPHPETVSKYLLARVLTADDVKPAKQLFHQLTSLQGQAAEILYILRPLIYALLMQRLAKTYGYEGTKWKRNWSPWLIGFCLEYFSRRMAKQDLENRVPGGFKSGLSALERDELAKRGRSLAWWSMRGAFYENVTRKYVQGFAGFFQGKPLLDLIGGVVEDYDYLWSNYYFSTPSL